MPSKTPLFDSIVNGRTEEIRYISGYEIKDIAPHITCADGTRLSVQAGQYLYCTPRQNRGPYTAVEVGYPTAVPPESWAEYFDGKWTPEAACHSVYAYIPVEMVREFILAHGGEKEVTNA